MIHVRQQEFDAFLPAGIGTEESAKKMQKFCLCLICFIEKWYNFPSHSFLILTVCCQRMFLSVCEIHQLCSVQLQTLSGLNGEDLHVKISLPKIFSSETEGQGSANPFVKPGLCFQPHASFHIQSR